MFEKLNSLCSVLSPSNFEEGIQAVFTSFVSKKAESIDIDCLGNVLASKNITNNDSVIKPIVLAAHCDEIGFIVNHIDGQGRVYVKNIGGINLNILECLRIDINHGGRIVKGVFCKRFSSDKNKTIEDISELWVDIGCSTFAEASSLVSIGDYATFETRDLICMGPNGDLLCGKSLDNRVGLLVVSEVFNIVQCTFPLYVCSVVQEEIGCRGAITMANRLAPSLCVVVDVTFATDIQGVNKGKYGEIILGNGVVIPLGANVNNKMQRKLMSIAECKGIKYQQEVLSQSSGTDAKTIQIARNGVDTVLISIPCRYMHSPIEMISINDVKEAIRLLAEFVEQVGTPLDHCNLDRGLV